MVPELTPELWAEWQLKWAAERERWATTLVPGAQPWSKAASSIYSLEAADEGVEGT